MFFLIKTLLSALVIALVSELGKRSTLAASILASLPLVSILAILWLFIDTKDPAKVSELSLGIFWAVLPSLAFFLCLPWLLKLNLNFYLALPVASLVMIGFYSLYLIVLKKLGLQ